MRTVYDIGVYDGADTAHYLEMGHAVVAVEANPHLIARLTRRFLSALAAQRLVLVHAAIAETAGTVALQLSSKNGASSMLPDWDDELPSLGTLTVPSIPITDLFAAHGVPYYLKVDIEGADRHAVLPLTRATRPTYLSFEIGDDWEELLAHCLAIGYRQFKVINQESFRALGRERLLRDRARHRLLQWLGFRDPRVVRRGGRFFRQGTSGPLPWQSDGPWVDASTVRRRYDAREPSGAWYDCVAH